MARDFSLVAGGAVSARSGPAGACAPAKAGAQTRVSAQRLRPTGPLHWKLPQPQQPTLSELFAAHPRDGGWIGFLLAQLAIDGPLLWVQDRMAILESGRIHPPGLRTQNLIHVEARDARDALWAMEEGVRCSSLCAVIGELWGDPPVLDFTASRRLAVASERSGTPCWLVRLGGTANLSGARMRWRVQSAQSLFDPLDPNAPGWAAWDAELFRARGMPPGRWSIAYEADCFRLVSGSSDRALDQERRLSA